MNPDTGIPEIHTEAALRAVDVVLCKSRLCVELMAAFRKDKSMRFGIMYTNHTTPDPLRLGARHPRACSRHSNRRLYLWHHFREPSGSATVTLD